MFKKVLMLSLILIMSTVYLVPTYALDFDEPADEPEITTDEVDKIYAGL